MADTIVPSRGRFRWLCGTKEWNCTFCDKLYNRLMYPAIFLDRDGVLIENKADYIRDWLEVKLIPQAIQSVTLLAGTSYKIVIVTNQSAVRRGIISMEVANDINHRLISLIHQHGGRVDGVYMCPHKPDDRCLCRKPRPGLLLQAAQDLSLALGHSWMIGDAWSDVQAGLSAGVQHAIILRTGRGEEQLLQPRPPEIIRHLVFDNLPLAVEAILTWDRQQAKDAAS